MIYKDTYHFLAMNRDSADTFLAKGEYRLLKNARISTINGQSKAINNIKGNLIQSNGNAQAGVNTVIGQVTDRKRDSVIFFVHNSNGNHGIFTTSSSSIIPVLIWSGLNFSPSNFINHATIIDDLLIWSDGVNNDRMINIVKALIGEYATPYNESQFNFIKQPPIAGPAVVRESDSSLGYNKISEDSYQFVYRYQYLNNEYSVFSDLSLISYGETEKTDALTNNKIKITIGTIPSGVKKVEVAYTKNNDGIFNIFTKGDNSQTVYYFTGLEAYETVDDVNANKLFEPASLVSGALTSAKNRIIKNRKKIGRDIDESQFTLSLTNQKDGTARKDIMKGGGYYEVGVVFKDEYGQSSGVKKRTGIFSGFTQMNTATSVDSNESQYLKANISGTPPAGYKYFQFVVSQEQSYEIYQQVVGQLLFFIVDDPDNSLSLTADQLRVDGKVYKKSKPTSSDQYTFLYIKLPMNVMFAPDLDCYVRLLALSGTVKEEKILAIEGDIIVVKNFGIENFSLFDHTWLLEIYKPSKTRTSRFYSCGQTYPITGGSFGLSSAVTIPLDTKHVKQDVNNNKGYVFNMSGFLVDGVSQLDYTVHPEFQSEFQSPSHVFVDRSDYSGAEIGKTRDFNINILGDFKFVTKVNIDNLFTIDYSKSAYSKGRVFVEVEDAELFQGNVLEFGDRYIQDSNINGIVNFSVVDQYPLPESRGDVVKLIMAGNVLLAIHSQYITSIYVGEGFIRQGDDFVLAKTEGFIGDDRLTAEYGTQHPESIVEHNSVVYGFDCRQGIVWRYAGQGGVFPISDYGMASYFQTKAAQYYGRDAKIVGGYDPQHNEYIITFPYLNTGSEVINPETVVFSERENRWIYFIDYKKNISTPSLYAKNSKLMSFLEGDLYLHNSSSVHNQFYGVQYQREFEFVFNTDPSRPKIANNIWLHADIVGSADDKPVEFSNAEGQRSHLFTNMLKKVEGYYRGPVMMDVNGSPNMDEDKRLFGGQRMRGKTMNIKIKDNSTQANPMRLVELLYKYSEFVK